MDEMANAARHDGPEMKKRKVEGNGVEEAGDHAGMGRDGGADAAVGALEGKLFSLAGVPDGDLGPAFGAVPGRKIEVKWRVYKGDNEEDQALDDSKGENKPPNSAGTSSGHVSKDAKASAPSAPEQVSRDEGAANDNAVAEEVVDEEEDEDDSDTVAVWWPATVVEKSGKTTELDDGVGGDKLTVPVYNILYDALLPYVATSESAEVYFCGKHTLCDLGTGDLMSWRLEGDSWDAASEDGAGADGGAEGLAEYSEALANAFEEISRTTDRARINEILRRNNLTASQFLSADPDIYHVPEGQEESTARNLVDAMLASALDSQGHKFATLPASAQNAIADHVQQVKSRLALKICDVFKERKLLDVSAAQDIVSELQEEIARVRHNL